jgi:hypothetical protein
LGIGDWLKHIFGSENAAPKDLPKLSSATKSDLLSSLQRLLPGQRAWIGLREAAHLFSTQDTEYAFGEMDEQGKRELDQFAAECRCDVQFMPVEGRLYFTRKD